jgi:hypothetical protein
MVFFSSKNNIQDMGTDSTTGSDTETDMDTDTLHMNFNRQLAKIQERWKGLVKKF